tara:strand:+ start:628 stop:903 length:276 start_codon:yes stop_codon:yes gene_type:complete
MPKIVVVSKALDVVNNLFKWFSADERKKRRQVQYDDRIKLAINLQEKHYDELLSFLNFLEDKLELSSSDKKYYNQMKAKFKKDNRKFKELT